MPRPSKPKLPTGFDFMRNDIEAHAVLAQIVTAFSLGTVLQSTDPVILRARDCVAERDRLKKATGDNR